MEKITFEKIKMCVPNCPGHPEYHTYSDIYLRSIFGKKGKTPIEILTMDIHEEHKIWILTQRGILTDNIRHKVNCEFLKTALLSLDMFSGKFYEFYKAMQDYVAGGTTSKKLKAFADSTWSDRYGNQIHAPDLIFAAWDTVVNESEVEIWAPSALALFACDCGIMESTIINIICKYIKEK